MSEMEHRRQKQGDMPSERATSHQCHLEISENPLNTETIWSH